LGDGGSFGAGAVLALTEFKSMEQGLTLEGKRILLIIGGGIAAYKSLDLIRRLRERGAIVRAVLTAAGKQFVTPLSVASLTGNPVHEDLFCLTEETEMGHIELSRSADLLVVAPATADLLAKAAAGIANDLASTILLATDKRVLMAPAMNVRMWHHPATVRNVAQLREDGLLLVGPSDGEMACGEYGPGRMSEPMEILASIAAALQPTSQVLAGRRVIVTSGPTHEPIDPVRYIANRSSGRQGHAIAAAAAQAGANVTLVTGPVSIPDPVGVSVVRVETAKEMLAAVKASFPADIFIGAAAVADWGVEDPVAGKIKKERGSGPPVLALVENPDILAEVSRPGEGRPSLVVGFAAETGNLIGHALSKLQRKGCDLIVANDVGPGTGVMGGSKNMVHLISSDQQEAWPLLDKGEVARRLIQRFAGMLGK
jgi:phosphopantothenoylcysteine decarboxylase/phosphopantothenate--cysteine ligase